MAEKTSGHWLLTGNLSIGNNKESVRLQSSGSSKACLPKEQAVHRLGERWLKQNCGLDEDPKSIELFPGAVILYVPLSFFLSLYLSLVPFPLFFCFLFYSILSLLFLFSFLSFPCFSPTKKIKALLDGSEYWFDKIPGNAKHYYWIISNALTLKSCPKKNKTTTSYLGGLF